MAKTDAAPELERLGQELERAFGAGLIAVVLYGSAARGDHQGAGRSDLNVLVVLEDISLEALERAAAIQRSWRGGGNHPLLFFSPEWIERSLDVFPMEFLDMQESHRVVRGRDPFADFSVRRENLRLQCESEIKTRLIQLRTGFLEFCDDPEGLARLLAASYAPAATLCRAVIRLSGEQPPPHSADAVRRAAALCGLDPAPFEETAAVKRGGSGAASVPIKTLFTRYYDQFEALARAVDAGLPRTQTGGGSR